MCSTDMFLDIPQPVELDYSRTPVVMLSTWASLDYARHHGVLKLAADVGLSCLLAIVARMLFTLSTVLHYMFGKVY